LPGGKPLPGGRELGIPGAPARLVNQTQTWDRQGAQTEGSGGGLAASPALGVPVDHNGVALTQGQTVANGIEAAAGKTGGTETHQQVQQQLKERGMDWSRHEEVAGGVRFMCTIPDRQNPSKIRTYEATAATELAAMKAVLEQITRDP
jgi:hypothetical protein